MSVPALLHQWMKSYTSMFLAWLGTGVCVADALLLESEARFNDGSVVDNGLLTLDPMDGIVLSNGKQCPNRRRREATGS